MKLKLASADFTFPLLSTTAIYLTLVKRLGAFEAL